MKVLKTVDEYLSQPYRTRRLLILLSSVISLAVVVFANVTDREIKGETLLITLTASSAGVYGATKIFGQKEQSEDV